MIATLFTNQAVVLEAETALVDHQLLPQEWAYIRGAVPARRAEFGTARVLARRALAALGLAGVALNPGRDRAPTWPAGVVGSITHTRGYCAVVLGRSPPLRSVGIDAEELRALDPGVVAMVLRPDERDWLREQPRTLQEDLAVIFFSAKEAYYKCQYPLSETFLDFQDVQVNMDLDAGRFSVQGLKADLPDQVARLSGKFIQAGGKIICGVELET
jgi:4'-phosphopantetheinyl transferase EntD